MGAFATAVEATIARWHVIDPAKWLASDLEASEKPPGTVAFEDVPSRFEAARQAAKEGA